MQKAKKIALEKIKERQENDENINHDISEKDNESEEEIDKNLKHEFTIDDVLFDDDLIKSYVQEKPRQLSEDEMYQKAKE